MHPQTREDLSKKRTLYPVICSLKVQETAKQRAGITLEAVKKMLPDEYWVEGA